MLSRQGLQDVLDVVMGGGYTYSKPPGIFLSEYPAIFSWRESCCLAAISALLDACFVVVGLMRLPGYVFTLSKLDCNGHGAKPANL